MFLDLKCKQIEYLKNSICPLFVILTKTKFVRTCKKLLIFKEKVYFFPVGGCTVVLFDLEKFNTLRLCNNENHDNDHDCNGFRAVTSKILPLNDHFAVRPCVKNFFSLRPNLNDYGS